MIPQRLPKANIVFDEHNQHKAAQATLSDVYSVEKTGFLNEYTLYLTHFNYIPNYIIEHNIDCKKAHAWFLGEFEEEIKNCYFNKRYFGNNKNFEYDDVIYFTDVDLIVNFDTNLGLVRFLFRQTDLEKVEDLAKSVRRFKKRKRKGKPELFVLVSTINGIEAKVQDISRQKLCVEENYNDDFLEIDGIIKQRLSKKNDKGIILLHGKPGTGKTSYIRHLITNVKKDVIFLPPNMAGLITNPNLISILLDNPNSIFVIEDAENIVIDRTNNGDSPVSALLNISDGLLSDCLNIQIICSFNTPLSKVDSALLRKGRLIARYEFKELCTEKAQKLSGKLGFTSEITEPMGLNAIYNQGEKDFEIKKPALAIGF